jgi:hypothetical protein
VSPVTIQEKKKKKAARNKRNISNKPLLQDGTVVIYGTRESSVDDSQTVDGDPGPSRMPGPDISNASSDDDNSQLDESQNHVKLPAKRAREIVSIEDNDDDERSRGDGEKRGGSSSSPNNSCKRQRSDGSTPFTQDHLNEEEFAQLLAQGYFN